MMYQRIAVEFKTEMALPVVIGAGIIDDIPDLVDFSAYSAIVLLTDTTVGKLYGERVIRSLNKIGKKIVTLTFPPGERTKSAGPVARAYRFLMDSAIDRDALLVVLGGGVVGDLGGYIASTYLRGVDYIQIPTTLLAQVDSSIGGKVGINFGGKKNMVGSFYQPVAIISDVSCLKSLPAREMRNGMAEVIKYGLAIDKELFNKLGNRKSRGFTRNELIDIVTRCAGLKARVVEADETDRSGKRSILNFGHTAGHAVEAAAALRRIRHGEAVAIGMVVASRISNKLNMLEADSIKEIESVLEHYGLPARCPGTPFTEITKALEFDKKITHGQLKWVLLDSIGNGVVNCTVDKDTVIEVLGEVCP